MKIYISCDIEGVNGVIAGSQCGPSGDGYGNARLWMTEEANAAIRGASRAGAEEIVVKDSHGSGTNMLLDKLDGRAQLISGWGMNHSMVEGLDETFEDAGSQWQYVSIDTHIIGMVIRGATGRSIPDLLSEKVIMPLGPKVEPYYVTDGFGVAFVLGGLNLTTHDYALFGHMIANGGISFGTRIVSEAWIEESTAPSAPTAAGEIGYGYQWWIPVGATQGQFMARGIYGQYIYIDRPRGVVIAVNGADRNFRADGAADSNVAMFRAIAGRLE